MNIVILGSTGSIGTNALEIVRKSKDKFRIVGISGHNNYELLLKQVEEFNPKYISVGTEKGYEIIKSKFPDKEIYFGSEGLKELASKDDYDILLTAVSGVVGIEATVEGIKRGKRIALANKETMVAGGELINKLLKENKNSEIIPVDSEHSAIFQALLGGKKKEVKKLIITASCGTFRGKKIEELANVTVEQALKHPNWSMGRKITIDSSTLVNKGLEVIEAHQLFGIGYDNIEVLVHPQSIIHSMVEFRDSSIIAQMGVPDMKLPIQYAFTYPDREENEALEFLDFKKITSLTFEQVDNNTFKGIRLAFEAGRIGKSMPAVFNGANEIAVDLFLKGKIKFLTIYEIIEKAMKKHTPVEIDSVEVIKRVDKETREWIILNYAD